MNNIHDADCPRGMASTEHPSAVFGYEEFWPKVYAEFKQQFDAVGELLRLGDEMVKAAEDVATEPVKKVICALSRATITGACETLLLCGNGCGAGAMKIVRGMYESKWSAEYLRFHPDEADDYIEFSKVILWRRLKWVQEYDPTHVRVTPEKMKTIEDDYNAVKDRFTDRRGNVRHRWHKKPIGTIAEEVGRKKEYDFPYAIACSIHHNNFEGLSALFALDDGGKAIPDPPPSSARVERSLIAAYTNLWFALSTLNDSCGLGFSQRLDAMQEILKKIPKVSHQVAEELENCSEGVLTMTDSEIVRRLEKVERENRFYKLATICAACGAVILILMGAVKSPRTIEAEKIVLLDSHGQARVTIGTPRFTGAAVDMQPDDPAIWISDTNGADRTIITADGIYFADSNEKRIVDLNSYPRPGLKFYGPDGKVNWMAP